MDKKYDHKQVEKKIYEMWQDSDAFSPEGAKKLRGDSSNNKPFSILMPPPNANAPLHCGHATYAIQDLVIRFKRMQGYDALYLPGTDHAGFETQVVYERKLAKEKKSRFDFDRETLYKDIYDFVQENSEVAIDQLKQLGMSADWNRNTFMLDQKVIDTVYDTFMKMEKDGLVYRDGYMVNYSPRHGTTFSDLETEYIDAVSPLYYVKYAIKDSDDTITVATVRPETIYADVAIAVHPDDKRYKSYVGQVAINPLNGREMKIISDKYVDIEFGTGALKVTPGHDHNDYEIGKRHNLEVINLIEFSGAMNSNAGECDGLYPNKARAKSVEILEGKKAIEKIDEKYENRVLVDYKDHKPIEPMVMPNWFIDMDKLSNMAIDAVENDKVTFNRLMWKKEVLRWLKEKRPWPISRQTVFGIRIPAWYKVTPELQVTFISKSGEHLTGCLGDLLDGHPLDEIKKGLQRVIADDKAEYVISVEFPGEDYLPETDTFDTWFSSGQWPMTTLGYPEGEDFKKHYPTNFLDSMWDIIFFWIARMIMFGLYLTDDVPFKHVYFHGAVSDKHGKKMSKSKGNVIDPLEFVEKYGADALRMGIIVGGNTESRYSPLDEDKVRGYRNFANKIWNVARFMNMKLEGKDVLWYENGMAGLIDVDKKVLNKLDEVSASITKHLENYKFKYAGEELYQFIWEDLANGYLEDIKDREDEVALSVLHHVFLVSLKLLHPFMPFVTEAIWQEMPRKDDTPLIVSKWPS